jgi:hypothetical protein
LRDGDLRWDEQAIPRSHWPCVFATVEAHQLAYWEGKPRMLRHDPRWFPCRIDAPAQNLFGCPSALDVI